MDNQFLTTIVCVLLPVTILLISAGIGILSRVKTFNRILQLESEGKYNHWAKGEASKKIRLLSILGLLTLVGIGIAILMIIINPSILLSKTFICGLSAIVLIGIAVGIVTYRRVLNP